MPDCDKVIYAIFVGEKPETILPINSHITSNRQLAAAEAYIRSLRHGGKPWVLQATLTKDQALMQFYAAREIREEFLTNLVHNTIPVGKVWAVVDNFLRSVVP